MFLALTSFFLYNIGMNKNKKIIVAMSGGVDSSVVAALLVKKGYNVTGMFAVNYEGQDKFGNSCWRDDYEDALRISAKLGIKLLRLNFVEEYRKKVLEYTYNEYNKGRTPNPDVMCNKFIKFDVWIKKIKELGYDKIATGHYARLSPRISNFQFLISKQFSISNFKLLQAKDKNKDQTYFLHQLSKEQLKDVLFPLGKYTKNHVRKLAEKFDLVTKDKEESMGICFVGEVPMKEFLKDKVKAKKGDILLSPHARGGVRGSGSSGEVVGTHDGLPFYTIGQRIAVDARRHSELLAYRQAGVSESKEIPKQVRDDSGKKPLFIVGKNIKKNELTIGFADDPLLFKKEIKIKNMHWVAGQELKLPLKCCFRLRHRQTLEKGVLSRHNTQYLILNTDTAQRAVTSGQFAVIYKGKVCLGGGEIV